MNILVWEIILLGRLQLTKKFEKGAVIIPVRSAMQCEVCVFRTAHQYLKSANWYFILEGLSDTWEVRTDRYQRSVDFCELHTDLWEVRTSIQEGRYDV